MRSEHHSLRSSAYGYGYITHWTDSEVSDTAAGSCTPCHSWS